MFKRLASKKDTYLVSSSQERDLNDLAGNK